MAGEHHLALGREDAAFAFDRHGELVHGLQGHRRLELQPRAAVFVHAEHPALTGAPGRLGSKSQS